MESYTVDPHLSKEAFAKAREMHAFRADLLTWTTVHGNLQLALRHPANVGASRAIAENFVKELGAFLVARGFLTAATLEEAERREAPFRPRPRIEEDR